MRQLQQVVKSLGALRGLGFATWAAEQRTGQAVAQALLHSGESTARIPVNELQLAETAPVGP